MVDGINIRDTEISLNEKVRFFIVYFTWMHFLIDNVTAFDIFHVC